MSVVANVAVNLDARSARRQLEDFINSSRRATDQLQDFANRSRQTETAIGGVARAVGKLALAYGTLRTAQAALQAGISRVESERRIQFLARGYGEAAQLATAASRAAQKFGVSQTEANQALANTYARLRPVGIELSTIESVYAGFNTAARISGASAVEASNAFTQLAQALGSGALRGDEFNSISEQVPGILTAISKETGVAQGALRKYAADGKITADVVIRALQRIEKEGADQLADALNGPQQKIKDLQNAAEDLQVALTEDVIPELAVNLKELAELIRNLEGPIRFIGGIAANTIGTINDLINLATKPGQSAARASIEGGRLPAFPLKGATEELFQNAITRFGTGLEGIEAEARALAETTGVSYADAFVASMQRQLAAIDAAKKLEQAFAGGEGGLRKPDSIIKPPADSKEAKKLADELARSLATGEKLFTQFSRQAVLTGEVSEIERKRLQIQYDYQDRAEQIAELKNVEQQTNLTIINDEIRRLELLELQTEQIKEQVEKAQKLSDKAIKDADFGVAGEGTVRKGIGDAIGKLKQELDPITLATNSIVNGAFAIGDAFATAFGEIITGSKTVQEALGDAFKKIGNDFISMAVDIIAKQMTLIILQTIFNALSGMSSGFQKDLDSAGKGLSGKGALATPFPGLAVGGRATGGPVSGGQPYVVGERGPELFVPSMNGGVMSNSDLRSAMNAAPGASGSPVLNMSFETTNIAGVEYVSRDQLEAAMAATRRSATRDGAKQGMSMTLDRLQQSPQVRSRVGLR